jgi:alkylation response protein AidB-like acyl-CoA dehydrogenase
MSVPHLAESPLIEDTDEQRELRLVVRKMSEDFGRDYFQAVAKRGDFPHEMWAALGEAGFLGVHVPTEYGGGGGGFVDLSIVLEETAAAGCPLQMIVISPTICGCTLLHHGTDEQKQEWLPGIASGERRMAFAITEPDAGTNTAGIKTSARPDGEGGWILSGAKYWTSGVDEAEAVLVVAKDAELSTPERSHLNMFIVPTSAPGFSATVIDSALRAPEKQFMTYYDEIRLGPDAIVGQRGAGLKQLFAGLNPERVAAASQANGLSLYALRKASAYANERSVWDTPIGAHQGVAHPLAEAYVQMQLARLMTRRAATLVDAGKDAGEAANMAKFASGDAALRSLDQAMQTHGGNGLSNEFGIADLWFTARMFKTAPVSREMILNFIAQHSLHLPKSY